MSATLAATDSLHNLQRIEVDSFGSRRCLQFHLFQRVNDTIGDHEISIPFPIGGYDVPGRMLRAGGREYRFKRRHVVGPALPFFQISLAELPTFLRIADARLQPRLLLVFGDVQKEFEDGGPVLSQQFFKLLDLI